MRINEWRQLVNVRVPVANAVDSDIPITITGRTRMKMGMATGESVPTLLDLEQCAIPSCQHQGCARYISDLARICPFYRGSLYALIAER